jgi:hypothetical protein
VTSNRPTAAPRPAEPRPRNAAIVRTPALLASPRSQSIAPKIATDSASVT